MGKITRLRTSRPERAPGTTPKISLREELGGIGEGDEVKRKGRGNGRGPT